MVFRAALAQIMQQQCNIQHTPVDTALENGGGDGKLFFQLVLFYARQVRDALDDMLVHVITVLHVKLHHRDDGLKFWNERGQDAQFVHAPQCPFRVAVLKHQIDKDTLGLGVAAHVIVNQ